MQAKFTMTYHFEQRTRASYGHLREQHRDDFLGNIHIVTFLTETSYNEGYFRTIFCI